MNEPGPPVPNLLLSIVATSLAWMVLLISLGALTPATGGVAALAVGTALGLGGVGTLVARAVPAPAEERLGLCGFERRWLGVVALLAPLAIVLSELDNGVAELIPRPERVADAGPPEALPVLLWALFALGLRPVVEEFFFRGVLLQGIASDRGRNAALATTSMLYALMHASAQLGDGFGFASLLAQGLVFGVVLGALRLASGSILPGVLTQVAVHGLGLAGVLAESAVPIAGFNGPPGHTPAVWLMPSLLCVGVAAWRIARGLREAPALPPIPPREEPDGPEEDFD